MLGDCLLGRNNFVDAEPLLVSGYEGMKEREASLPPESKGRLGEALDRVIRLYEAWGKSARAAEWRAKRQAKLGGDPSLPKAGSGHTARPETFPSRSAKREDLRERS